MPNYFGGNVYLTFVRSLVILTGLVCLGLGPHAAADHQVAGEAFPVMPEDVVTKGSLCKTGNTKRYPEGILYCERNVSTNTKKNIIKEYDEMFGYSIGSMNRQDFKIDHLIPLCAGGSNDKSNLWPQHKSVFTITDPLEFCICQKMAAGRLKQKDAIQIILHAKTHLDEVPNVMAQVESM